MDDFFDSKEKDVLSNFTPQEKKNPVEYSNMTRKQKVENFVLHIDDFDDDYQQEKKVDTVSNRPKAKGEVYFANYQRNAGDPYAPRYVGNNTNDVQPTERPVQPTARPLQPTARPVQPTARPVQPTARPVQPTARPVQPTARPVQPTARPVQPTARPMEAENVPISRAKKPEDNLNMFDAETKTGNNQPKQAAPTKNTSKKTKKRKILSEEELLRLKKNYSKSVIIAMAFVLVISITLSVIGINCVNDALAISGSTEEVEVVVPAGITTSEAINLFHDNDLLEVRWFSKLFAAFRGYDKEGKYYYSNGEKVLKPYEGGTYYLSESMGVEGMLNMLLNNSALSDQTVSITIPEGYTTAQIVRRLIDYEVINDGNKIVGAANYDYKYDFLDGVSSDTYVKLEGYLFPDTYEMYVGESASSVIKRLLDNFDEKWTDKYAKRAKELGLTTNEVLTIASIIQKEAADSSQMADISSVIHNRLKSPSTYPLLQCDSTELYVTTHLKDLAGEREANKYLDKYDTTVCTGLPEGPICNPGVDAINAALYPSDTTYMYFCHDKTGKVYYATTDIEHKQNVAKIK